MAAFYSSKLDKFSTRFRIELQDAALHYGGLSLFRGLNFSLEPACCTCLLGPSGVGKSSLLRIIAGLQSLDQGTLVCSDGGVLQDRLAWMGQLDSLLPWLTAEENVLLGARLRGHKPDRTRAADLLRDVGLTGQAQQRPATLSGGQRQRVALARTLMEERPVVLMDEPFSSLDAITRTKLQALSASLLQGKTVLLVTHDPLEALRLGHRIFIMAGRPATLEVIEAPAGAPPRMLSDRDLLDRQAALLSRLTVAQGNSV